jgi:uncharacterized membrane protein YgaE (UPF0421/DUF939 family)
MFLTRLIQHKGKGRWVLAMPMIVGVILATLYGELNFNGKYFTPIILILSSTIIWLIDVVSKTKAAIETM